MSLDQDAFSKLVESLYAAASEPTLWEPFLRQVANATQATAAALVMHDANIDTHSISHFWGLAPEFPRLYQEHFYSVDVWGERGRLKSLGFACTSQELCSLSELAGTEFYNDFSALSGVEHGLFIVAENREGRLASVSLYRDTTRPEFQASQLRILQALAPHVARAFKLHSEFTRMNARAAEIEAAINLFPTGVIFFGSTGKLICMNRCASAAVAEKDGLVATRGELRAERSLESALLERTIRQAAATNVKNGLRAGGTVLVSRRSRPPLQVQVSPIRNSMPFVSESIAAVAFIKDPARPQRPERDTLRVLYGLTPAESRVALLLSDGLAPRKIAEMVGVSFNTVRSHTKSIFSKTGVRRQGELIRILLNNPGIDRPSNSI